MCVSLLLFYYDLSVFKKLTLAPQLLSFLYRETMNYHWLLMMAIDITGSRSFVWNPSPLPQELHFNLLNVVYYLKKIELGRGKKS